MTLPQHLAAAWIEEFGESAAREFVVALVEELGGVVITGPAEKLNEKLRFEDGKMVVTSETEPIIVVRPDD